MKKTLLFTILSIFLLSGAFIAKSQNQVLNGNLEAWTDPNTPTDWTKAENITQATDLVHGGTYSAMHTSASSSKDLQQNVMTITGGQTYEISYWYYDNDPEASTRIWSYWLENETTTLTDNADELRSSEYSVDNPDWINYSVTLTAPANATGFRFEVRVYKQGTVFGGSVYYDDFSITSSTPAPEPTNYPTTFAANASGVTINLSWVDAIGEQLPTAYLIKASNEDNIELPVDGVPESNDADLADGSGIMNIGNGVEAYSFLNLLANTSYYFKIFSYTNGGAAIDYKTDGTPPAANATTADLTIINSENFNDQTLGSWSQYSVTGTQIWYADSYGSDDFAKMSGYEEGESHANEDWLISPALNFDDYINETFSFVTAMSYTGPDFEVKISNDYDGTGDPNTATWSNIEAELSPGFFEWTPSGEINISSYNGTVYLAFRYQSTDTESATWEVDDILVLGNASQGIGDIVNNENINVYPNPASEHFYIKANLTNSLTVNIYSIVGKLVLKTNINKQLNEINIDNLSEGVYFVNIINEKTGNEVTRKLIVQ
ncbi:MAG: choice-of-anchor J domain-containing protein [Bacteroidales bacterium]|nr:choice-of-anchor J domain-containing protein [Bacteroidales bacterium]